jgi:hypothetical protein
MKRYLRLIVLAIMFCLFASEQHGAAAVFQLSSPSDITSSTTINFEGHTNLALANTLFLSQGITFARDDGEAIFLLDWTTWERTTTSPRNVLATILVTGVNSKYVTHLNVLSSSPFFAMGAYFGNDQVLSGFPPDDFSTMRLSAYDLTDQLLGAVDVAVNHNTSVDQFIGIGSDLPMSRVRFENFSGSGTPSKHYSVVLDDLVFTLVQEPSTFSLLGIGTLSFVGLIKAKRQRKN